MSSHSVEFAQVNIGAPPPRLRSRHIKSRLGCSECKRRRIKCDEREPVCGACERRGLTCLRSSPTRKSPVVEAMLEDKSAHTADQPASTTSELSYKVEFLQLRLFYQFENKTIYTLVIDSKSWKRAIPLAFKVKREVVVAGTSLIAQYPFFMHALLMTAAAHLSYQHPENASYKNAELEHVTSATSGLRDVLSRQVSDDEVDAVFASCVLLYNQAWASYDEISQPDDDGLRPTANPDFLIPLGAGLKGMVSGISKSTILMHSEVFGKAITFSPKAHIMQHVRHTSYTTDIDRAFREEYLAIWPDDSGYFTAYMAESGRLIPVLSVLKLACNGLDLKPLESSIARYLYSWRILLSPKFIEAIEYGAPCAQLLFWHYYTVVQAGVPEKYWWAQKRAVAIISSLERSLAERGIRPRNVLPS